MTFADLSAGESIFLDANPLVYHFAPDPLFGPACNQLIARAGIGHVSQNRARLIVRFRDAFNTCGSPFGRQSGPFETDERLSVWDS